MRQKCRGIFLCLVLFVSLLLFSVHAVTAEASDLKSFYKLDYAWDTLSKGLDPNILFLLDISTSMTFDPDGFMPNEYDSRTISKRAQFLANSTYGQGMRPPLFDGR